MTFDDILAQIIDLLQRDNRVSYRALKVRFQLDDDLLEAVKDELIYAKHLAVDEGRPMNDLVEEALREFLKKSRIKGKELK